MPQSVKRPTLDLGSGHELTVGGIEPRIGLCTCLGFSLPISISLSLCPSPTAARARSLSQTNLKKKKRRDTRELALSTCTKRSVNSQREGSQEKRSHQNQTALTPCLKRPASRTVWNRFLLLKPPGRWCFVMAALADKDR